VTASRPGDELQPGQALEARLHEERRRADRLERELAQARAERERLAGILRAVVRSQSWRFGHAIVKALRRLTFRRSDVGPQLDELVAATLGESQPSPYSPARAAHAYESEAAMRRGILSRLGRLADRANAEPQLTAHDPRSGAWTVPSAPLSVLFVVAGVARRGSGGVHSVYQEARGLRALGVDAAIAIPNSELGDARLLYPDGIEVFRPHADRDGLPAVAAGADVLVSTHWRTVELVAQIARGRAHMVPAYYVQDYEPLFAGETSAEAIAAARSYHAIPSQILFAKTRWLCQLIATAEGVPVAKVEPSLDSEVYHAEGRVDAAGPVRVAAMVRPATPRRQPALTLRVLAALQEALAGAVEIRTFGCEERALGALGGRVGEHCGVLTRPEIASLLRGTDVFVDLSVYQAFGRTGLEAMACGATAVLPALGGTSEYARQEDNAVLVDTDDAASVFNVVRELVSDRQRVRRLQRAALMTASGFSIERSARSEYALFVAEHAHRFGDRERA
jgi:hypothetical protein